MLKKLFPFLGWFNQYSSRNLKMDATAGVTVALVLIPQSMAYAQLAGLPPYYGLYASLLPPLVAALFGSSRQLATGPVAVVSLMTAATLEPLASSGSSGYIAYALLLAIIVGSIQFIIGLLRLGVVINLLSHPVVNGFTNAAAIIIATSQLPKLFGVYIDKADHHYETVFRAIKAATYYTHWPTFLMGVIAFAIMIILKRIHSRIPSVLAAVVITTVLSWSFQFEQNITVHLEAIKDNGVKIFLNDFNTTLKSFPVLEKKRNDALQRQRQFKKSGDIIAMLDAERDYDVLNIHIEELKFKAAQERLSIRRHLFSRFISTKGTLSFINRKDVKNPEMDGGRIWRIKIGDRPVDTDRIVMIGGGSVVGNVPGGLPSFTRPNVDFDAIRHLFSYAAIIALLGFMEAISVAKAMAAKTGQSIDPNQELIGQGLSNIVGAFTGSYPVSGSFSRSAVNLEAGAVTGMSSFFTSAAVFISLLFLTPLLYHLPQSVLAAVIMMAVVGLINIQGFIHAWRAQPHDGIISIITFVATLVFAPHLDKGILLGVGLSLLVFLYKSMRPRVISLSLSPDKRLHDALTYGLKECGFIDVVRFDGPLFFANSSYMEDQIAMHRKNKPHLKHILLVAMGINDMDASGQETLSLVLDRVRSAGIDLSLCGVTHPVMDVLKRTHLIKKIGEDHIYPNIDTAIRAIHEITHKGENEADCPLTKVVYQEAGDQT